MNTQDTRFWRRIAIILVAVFAVYQFGLTMFQSPSNLLMLLLLSWLLSIAMEPFVAWVENRGQRRGLGAGVALLGIVFFTAAFLGTFGGLLFSQLAQAVESAPTVVYNITLWLNTNFQLGLDAEEILNALKLDTESLTPIATDLAGGLMGIVASVLTLTFDFITILVFAFYFSADAPRVKRSIAKWLKPEQQQVFVTVWEIAVSKTGGFVISKVVLAAISAIAHILFFWAIGIPYWLPMGIFAGITAQFVPTIGTYLGIAIPMLFTISSNPIAAVWVLVFATVYQQIENYVLTPRVSRATMDMHPAIALAAVFVGHAIFGPIGAIIGIPMVAGVSAVADTYGHRHELIPAIEATQSEDNNEAEN